MSLAEHAAQVDVNHRVPVIELTRLKGSIDGHAGDTARTSRRPNRFVANPTRAQVLGLGDVDALIGNLAPAAAMASQGGA